MTKTRGPGGKNRKKAKGSTLDQSRKELVFAEDGQSYAYVSESKGDGRYYVYCNDGVFRMAILRGKLWKRCWVRMHDLVLVSMRDYQDDKCDIIHRYSGDETLRLVSVGELSRDINKMLVNGGAYLAAENDVDAFVFEESNDIDIACI